eukprot:scaffold4099_cov403-Prasinococcus_capsulatus_cf.AAC.4
MEALEGFIAGHKLPKNHPVAVYVCLLVVGTRVQHLRGHPTPSSHLCTGVGIGLGPREAEVADLDVPVGINQQVHGLKVTVYDWGVARVQMVHAPCNLGSPAYNRHEAHCAPFLPKDTVKGPVRCVLHHNAKVWWGSACSHEQDDVRVPDLD